MNEIEIDDLEEAPPERLGKTLRFQETNNSPSLVIMNFPTRALTKPRNQEMGEFYVVC